MNHSSQHDSLSDEVDRDGLQTSEEAPTRRPSWFVQVAWWTAGILLLMIVVAGGAIWFVYQSAQKAPPFYQSALSTTTNDLERDGKEFESKLFELQNATQEAGPWQAVFSEEQVNGWLGSDLPEKFPDAIPPQIDQPRVSFGENEVQLAFRFKADRFSGIVVATADAFCAEQPNQIVIRIKSANAGVAPLPIGPWADEITKTLRRAGCKTRWREIGDDPTAIVTLPRTMTDRDDLLFKLETIQLTDGELRLGGVSVASGERQE